MLTVTCRAAGRPVENITLSFFLGDGVGSVSATATGEKRSHASGLGGKEDAGGAVGGGTWEFDPNTKVCVGMRLGDTDGWLMRCGEQLLKWTISSMIMSERPASLTGSFTSR